MLASLSPQPEPPLTGFTNALQVGLRGALRSLARQPLVAATVIAIVGLGVGATTAAFSVVRGVLVHSVPYPRNAELVQVTSTRLDQGLTRVLVAFPRFEAYAAQSRSFTALVAYATQDFTITDGPTPVSVPGVRVSAGFFRMLEVAPIAGREFSPDEQARGGARAAMIGERLWRTQFGSAPNVLERSISINGEAMPIVGVVPARLAPPVQDAEVWLPRVYETDNIPPAQVEGGSGYLRVMGRLNDGVTPDGAREDLQRVVADYRQRLGAMRDAPFDAAVLPLGTYLFGDIRGTLIFVWIAGTLVFLLACANAGNVLLARYLSRRTELDIRSAIGATRTHVLLHLLAESAVLGVAGLVAGLLIAAAVLQQFAPLAAQVLATSTPYTFDWVVFGVAGVLAVLAIVITAAVPAFHATAEHRSAVIETGSRAPTPGRGAARWRRGFVTAQVALSYLLLAGAFQQASALLRVQRLDRGYDPRGLLAFRIAPSAAKYPTPESRLELYRQLEERVGGIPGVLAVGTSQAMPVGDDQTIAFNKEAEQARKREEWPQAQFRIVSPGYFGALGATLVQGRGFTAADAKESPGVTVINVTLARKHFGNDNPVGARIMLGSFPGAREVVGVVSDVRQRWLETEPLPEAYIPGPQLPVRLPPVYFLVRSAVAPDALVPAIRTAVAAQDPGQSVTRVRTMTAAAAEGLAIPRMRAFLVVGFALVGALLAAVGLWSVVSQYVAERRREIAIRVALGAPPGAAAADVLRSIVVMMAVGVAVGLAVALTLGRVAQQLLVGLEPPGALMLLAACVPLVVAGAVTAYVHARRATRVDPARVIAG